MINIHSITFKFTAIILSASLLFLIIIGSLTTQLVIDQYESMEQNKLETIADNVTETLALNISYGFDKAIQETADTLYQNKQVLYLCIKDLKHDISKNSREGKSFTEYQKLHHFMLDEELLDPISQENIGSIQLIYSRSLFDTMILHYYNKLAFIMGIFLFFLMIFSFFLHRTMKPLSHLAYEMNNFDPKAPTNFDFTSKDRCEIGLIARASNNMINSINDYISKLSSLKDILLQRESHLIDAQKMAHVGSWEYWIDDNTFTMSEELIQIFGINSKNNKRTWIDFLGFTLLEDRDFVENIFNQSLKEEKAFNFKYRCVKNNKETIYIHTQGHVYKNNAGSKKITGVSMDITEQHQSQVMIEKLAYYDSLTGLPNRSLFRNRLTKAISLCNRNKSILGVLFIDLDHFKLINDSLGHMVGDELLRHISKILVKSLREEDTVSRLVTHLCLIKLIVITP